jgi:hypothetical protein
MSIRNRPPDSAVYGVDIGENMFHVIGRDSSGLPIQKATFRRETLLQQRAGRTRDCVEEKFRGRS